MSLHASRTAGYCRMRIHWILYLKPASVVIYVWADIPYISTLKQLQPHIQVKSSICTYCTHQRVIYIFCFEGVTLQFIKYIQTGFLRDQTPRYCNLVWEPLNNILLRARAHIWVFILSNLLYGVFMPDYV